jgi:uncharacterized membrane protein
MKLKTYKLIQMTVAALLGIVFSQAVINQNFIIPVIAAIIGTLTLLILRRRVKEVVADERDYTNAGRAALIAVQLFSWIAVVIMISLLASRDANPAYEPIAATLAYSTCFLMLAYALIFKFYDRFKHIDAKKIYLAVAVAIILGIAAIGLRLFSGEDGWICKNGQWIKHGQPSYPAPQTECK